MALDHEFLHLSQWCSSQQFYTIKKHFHTFALTRLRQEVEEWSGNLNCYAETEPDNISFTTKQMALDIERVSMPNQKYFLPQELPISGSMPDTNCPILRTSNNNWKFRMETNCRNVVCVAFQCLNTTLGLVVPYLHPWNLFVKSSSTFIYDQKIAEYKR